MGSWLWQGCPDTAIINYNYHWLPKSRFTSWGTLFPARRGRGGSARAPGRGTAPWAAGLASRSRGRGQAAGEAARTLRAGGRGSRHSLCPGPLCVEWRLWQNIPALSPSGLVAGRQSLPGPGQLHCGNPAAAVRVCSTLLPVRGGMWGSGAVDTSCLRTGLRKQRENCEMLVASIC